MGDAQQNVRPFLSDAQLMNHLMELKGDLAMAAKSHSSGRVFTAREGIRYLISCAKVLEQEFSIRLENGPPPKDAGEGLEDAGQEAAAARRAAFQQSLG